MPKPPHGPVPPTGMINSPQGSAAAAAAPGDSPSPRLSETAADSDFVICEEISSALERGRSCNNSRNSRTRVVSRQRRGQQHFVTGQQHFVTDHAESEQFTAPNYMSRTDITSASSDSDSSSSGDEKILAQFASMFSPSQQQSFISNTRRSKGRLHCSRSSRRQTTLAVPSDTTTSATTSAAGSSSVVSQVVTPATGTAPSSRPPKCVSTHRSTTSRRGGRRRPRRSRMYERQMCLLKVLQTSAPVAEFPPERQGELWATILPLCVTAFMDLRSIMNLRRACTSLYYGVKYSVASVNFDFCSTFTETEILNDVMPRIASFLTHTSFARMTFARCCLLTDAFPKALISFEDRRFARQVRSLIFDYCYALSDKSLETLLSTPLPHLEVLSLRCARSRDLTGAPFSTKDLLSKERWPRFHQLSCSCTQITLPHLDVVSRFLAERAIQLSSPPRLGIGGSLASYSLLRRLGLENEHRKFVDAIVRVGTVAAVEAAVAEFETKWYQNIDEGENKHKVLHRLVRNRWNAILVNAPCSVDIVDDGDGHEKAMWLLMGRQSGRRGSASSRSRSTIARGQSPSKSSTSEQASYVQQNYSCNRPAVCDCCCWQTQHAAGATPIRTSSARYSDPAIRPIPMKSDIDSNDGGSGTKKVMKDEIFVFHTSLTRSDIPPDLGQPGAKSSVVSDFLKSPPTESVAVDSKSPVRLAAVPRTPTDPVCEDFINSKQANYTRWTYSLPIAIRLGILPIVKYLIGKGAYVDVWGYNFATPLYIAVSNCVPRDSGSSISREVVSGQQPPLQHLMKLDSLISTTGAIMTSLDAKFFVEPSPVEKSDPNSPSSDERELRTRRELVSPDVTVIAEADDAPSVCTAPGRGLSRELTFGSLTADNITDEGLCRLGSEPALCACACHRVAPEQKTADDDRVPDERGAVESYNAIVDLLLDAAAPVDAPDLYSIKCPINAAIKNDNVEMLEKLISRGARINVHTPNVIPPEIQLSRRPHQKKLPPRGLTRLGYKSPLFLGCELDAWKCVAALLDHGANPHCRDPFSSRNVTPALLAYRKRPGMLQLFVSKGAGNTKETRWALSEVLAVAILQDDIDTIGFLVSLYPDLLERESSGMWSLPLIQSARLNKVLVLQTLLGYGACPNAINTEGLAALHLAASEGHQQAMECLLLHGAEPNIQGGSQRKAPLHIAVEENRRDVVETLLNYKADITIKNSDGMTPLMAAIATRNDKVAIALIERARAAELDTCDIAGRTPLMYAIYFGQFKVADKLVEKGVTCRVMDVSGATAESMLKQKIQSLGKAITSGSTINKFLRNIVGAGVSQPPASISRSKDPDAATSTTETANVSDESVRRLNNKRKKVAKRLLKRIRVKPKKEQAPTVASLSTTTSVLSPPKLPVKPFITASFQPSSVPHYHYAQQTTAPVPESANTSPVLPSYGEVRSKPDHITSSLSHVAVPAASVTAAAKGITAATAVVSRDSRVAAPTGDSPLSTPHTQNSDNLHFPAQQKGSLDCSWHHAASSVGEDDDDDLSSVSSQSSESSSAESELVPLISLSPPKCLTGS